MAGSLDEEKRDTEGERSSCASCLDVIRPRHSSNHCPAALLSAWHVCFDCLLPTETAKSDVFNEEYLCTCDRPTLARIVAAAGFDPDSLERIAPGGSLTAESPSASAPVPRKSLLEAVSREQAFRDACTLLTAKCTDLPRELSPFEGTMLRDNPRARVLPSDCEGLVMLRKRLAGLMPARLVGISGPAIRWTEVPVVPASSLTPREFWHRFVKHNVPVKLTGAVRPELGWNTDKWDLEYLKDRCGSRKLTVRTLEGSGSGTDGEKSAAPEAGKFGSVAKDSADAPIYVEKEITFAEYLEATKKGTDCPYYAARIVFERDLPELCDDFPMHSRYRECFGDPLFAGVVGYIGAGGNTSPKHVDYLDNCLQVVRGSKHLILHHPGQADLLRPRTYGYNYSSVPPGTKPGEPHPDFPFWEFAKSLEVTVNEGEMLYLPFAWWHEVSGGPEFNVIVNHWYDMHHAKRARNEIEVPFKEP